MVCQSVALSSKKERSVKKVASSAHMSNTQVLFLETTITLQSAEVLSGCVCLQNNRNSLLDGSLVLLVCMPAPQESQGERTLWVLHSTQASRLPVWSVLLGTGPTHSRPREMPWRTGTAPLVASAIVSIRQ